MAHLVVHEVAAEAAVAAVVVQHVALQEAAIAKAAADAKDEFALVASRMTRTNLNQASNPLRN